jgi:hypothetical protein
MATPPHKDEGKRRKAIVQMFSYTSRTSFNDAGPPRTGHVDRRDESDCVEIFVFAASRADAQNDPLRFSQPSSHTVSIAAQQFVTPVHYEENRTELGEAQRRPGGLGLGKVCDVLAHATAAHQFREIVPSQFQPEGDGDDLGTLPKIPSSASACSTRR